MPELPEVENVRQGLEKLIVGKKIIKINLPYSKIVTGNSAELINLLENQTIEAIKRRGKYLIFIFKEKAMISHLRMEGKYHLESLDYQAGKHDHALFQLDSEQILVYQDVRKFGRMELIDLKELDAYFKVKKLGPEPVELDFDLQVFSEKLKSVKKIKPYLLEQTLVVGLGNIYVDEVLWKAKIHPTRAALSLTELEIKRLRQAIIDILGFAVKVGGSSIRTYKNAFGQEGQMQNYLQVYGKTGNPCPRCSTPIEKIKLAGRGTHFCPNCQKSEM